MAPEAPIILEANGDGKVGMVLPQYTNIVNCTSIAINNARRLMDEPILKNALKHVASKVLPQRVDSWRKNLDDDYVVNTFKVKVQQRFPLSFVARDWHNPDLIGGHFRREYFGNGHDFDPHKQGIMVNAEKLNKMCVAGVRAVTSHDPNSDDSKRFRAFIFTMTKTYVHELAHVFVTFLGQGTIDTPPDIGAQKTFELITKPEAGRYVEKAVFGGLVSPLRNPDEDDNQAGVLHLDTGNGVRQIKQETIDDFVNHKFNLPLTDLGPPKPPGWESLGHHHPRRAHSGDPLDDPEAERRLEEFKANPIRWDAVEVVLKEVKLQELTKDMESVLTQAGFNPQLLIKHTA